MSADDLFRSVASVLLSTSSKECPTKTSPSSVVAEQLENAGDEQKQTLSRLLAELLRGEETPNVGDSIRMNQEFR